MLNKYGFCGVLKMMFYYIYTKIFFPHCRLIRFPFDIRNSNNICLGNGFTSGFNCRIESYGGIIRFGKRCQINDNVHIASANNIIIGDDFLCASRVFITDLNHGNYSGDNHSSPYCKVSQRPLTTKPIIIGNNVWVGESVNILPGVVLGDNCIIGSGSVVTKSIPPNSIAVGNPCVVIKVWDENMNCWLNK
ncbi:acetyltransferase [Photobacterium phosphoreum]|uniref:DapH/DapD/GlmU-related protein n=1 Tax=Photobacterium phosphoreum TaxID=659 RepID=UPI000D177659|nr:DapH/DapD/GlmU-related protein [Photobacterium phosphoreum]PSW34960.1 acetyltransferase [Photobacterium phosphoreum]